MAHSLGKGLAGLAAPGKAVTKSVPRGKASIGAIEPLTPTKPKTFADKNTDTRYLPQDIPAKGGSISPSPNPSVKSAKDRVRDISTT